MVSKITHEHWIWSKALTSLITNYKYYSSPISQGWDESEYNIPDVLVGDSGKLVKVNSSSNSVEAGRVQIVVSFLEAKPLVL